MNLFREQLYRETVCGGTFHSKTSDVAVIALARPRGCLDVHAGRSMVNSLMHLMRRWRNVCEEGTAIFFHGSRREFPVGFILTPQREGYVHGVAGDEFDAGIRRVEAVFERHRPPQMISRLNAVFLAPTIAAISYAGGHDNYVYKVAPIGICEKSYLWWYDKVEQYLLDDTHIPPKLAKRCAENYWRQTPPPTNKTSMWEYRCHAARITQLVK